MHRRKHNLTSPAPNDGSRRSWPPRGIGAFPQVATLYLQWSNRFGRAPIAHLAGLGISGAAIAGSWILWARQLERHTVMTAVLAGVVAAAFVSNRRGVHAARAPRSWLAALPITPRMRRIEALALQAGPLLAVLSLISVVALLSSASSAAAGMSARGGLLAWRSLLLGTFVGAGVGLLAPLPKTVSPVEGSRYVPHRAAPGRHPVPSLAGLASWPIRNMFAVLRPKTLSRMLLPVLIMMPLGTPAATGMVWVGIFGAGAALLSLAVSTVHVLRAARRWLQPLPLPDRRLVVAISGRAVVVMMSIGAVAAWLRWVAYL